MSLRTADYNFELPERLIARYPPPGRSDARMLVLDRATRQIEHRAFRDFSSYVDAARGDLVVLNDTRVLPARLRANAGALELLVLGPADDDAADDLRRVVCLVKPGRRARIGASVQVGDNHGIVESIQAEGGARVIRFDAPLDPASAGGELPLPPYLGRIAEPLDTERYQTVYARQDVARAVAAPTAGLHFTPEILQAVPHAFVTLEVGIGTFRTVKTEDLSAHRMHAEKFEITAATAARINAARARGGRLFAVGTTTVRVLEACARESATGDVLPQRGETDIFLHPPNPIRGVDTLLTNFHLPKSTLLMLVSALVGDREWVLDAYREAIRAEYRFFSYGDCMLIL